MHRVVVEPKREEAQSICFLHFFDKRCLHGPSQTPSGGAKACGLNFHRLGLPQHSSAHTRDHRESHLLTAVQKCFLFWSQPHPPSSCCPCSVLAKAAASFHPTPKSTKPPLLSHPRATRQKRLRFGFATSNVHLQKHLHERVKRAVSKAQREVS